MLKKIVHTKSDWQEIVTLGNKYAGITSFAITLDSDYKKRSLDQNAYFHKICQIVANKKGSSAAYWKSCFKQEFGLKNVLVGLDQQPFVEVVSTTDYTTQQMNDFITMITAWCAENDLQILSPEEFFNKGVNNE